MLKYIKHKHRIQSKCNTDKGTFEIPKKKKMEPERFGFNLKYFKKSITMHYLEIIYLRKTPKETCSVQTKKLDSSQ